MATVKTLTINATNLLEILGEELGEEVLGAFNDLDSINLDGAFVATGEVMLDLLEGVEDDLDETSYTKAKTKLKKFENELVVINADTLPE